MFKGSEDEPHDFVQCSQSKYAKYPACKRGVLIGDRIFLHFAFSRDFLGNVADIEKSLLAHLNSFRVSGPTLEIIP